MGASVTATARLVRRSAAAAVREARCGHCDCEGADRQQCGDCALDPVLCHL